jgi:type IV pilus assembly protein PilA
MLTTLCAAQESDGLGSAEAGFTLIELMVVLLIIAILLAIAIPTFLGVSGSANDRAAQSNLTNALTEVKALYQNSQTYVTGTLSAATLTTSAPEFSWVQNAACGSGAQANCISEYPVDVAGANDGQGVILSSYSKANGGTCWYAVDLETAPSATTFVDTGGTVQFVAGTTAASPWVQASTASGSPVALTSAGAYYAKQAGNSCNANKPVTTGSNGQWNWGISFSTPGSN